MHPVEVYNVTIITGTEREGGEWVKGGREGVSMREGRQLQLYGYT